MQNYPISPCPLDQHPVVQIRVCTVCTGDEFALDPLPIKKYPSLLIEHLFFGWVGGWGFLNKSFSSLLWGDIPSLGLSPPCFQIRPNVLPSDGTCSRFS